MLGVISPANAISCGCVWRGKCGNEREPFDGTQLTSAQKYAKPHAFLQVMILLSPYNMSLIHYSTFHGVVRDPLN